MYYQNKPGFYSYHYDILGDLFSVRYPTIEDFFRNHSEFYVKSILVDKIFKHVTAPINRGYFSHYATILCDHNGKLYTPDRVIGLYRIWIRKRNDDYVCTWNNRYHCGKKRGAYGGYRRIKTFQEAKMWFDVDPDYNIRGRAGRSKAGLPDTWDDYYSHSEKSWKFQSKRKHQYR